MQPSPRVPSHNYCTEMIVLLTFVIVELTLGAFLLGAFMRMAMKGTL